MSTFPNDRNSDEPGADPLAFDGPRRALAGASETDTIVAQATAPGRGALAVVRLEGPDVLEVRQRCFRHVEEDAVPAPKPNRAAFGRWIDPASGETIDEVVATYFAAPHSYTGGDILEISCHGSNLICGRIIEACAAAGARPARPGEFTERAFLNGKIDLSRAQAVVELIDAATRAAQRHALTRLRGGLEREIHAIESDLLDAAALIEAYLDFPEEDVGADDNASIERQMIDGRTRLDRLLATWDRGRLETEGVRVVLAGEPNVGKSSLFNALIGRARALVTPIAGTTRDVIDARLDIGGVPVTLIDTAGLRETEDEIELLGVGRTHQELAEADTVLWLFDASRPLAEQRPDHLRMLLEGHIVSKEGGGESSDSASFSRDSRRVLVVLNKADHLDADAASAKRRELEELNLPLPEDTVIESVSAIEPATLQPLIDALRQNLLGVEMRDVPAKSGAASEVVVADVSQFTLLQAAREALERAASAFGAGLGGELVMVDLQESLDNLAQLTGSTISEEKLDRVFRRFCLGK